MVVKAKLKNTTTTIKKTMIEVNIIQKLEKLSNFIIQLSTVNT